MSDITQAELLKAIEEAISAPADDGPLPRCEPGALCPAILEYHHGMSHYQANRTIRKMYMDGKLKPGQIMYTGIHGNDRLIYGYWLVRDDGSP
jgi:hypothetical protein